jgi:hypothetical protein
MEQGSKGMVQGSKGMKEGDDQTEWCEAIPNTPSRPINQTPSKLTER